jgi:hypothetical protein
MSEEPEVIQEPQPKKAMPGFVRKAVSIGSAVLGAAIVALLLYNFVLAPRLSDEPAEAAEPRQPADYVQSVTVQFEQANVSAQKPVDDMPASLLLYKVAFVVSNEYTAALVDNNRAWFLDMLRELHSGHPREKLDDPMLRRSIQKQAVIRANELLTEIQGRRDPENRVLKVFHEEFFVYDQ